MLVLLETGSGGRGEPTLPRTTKTSGMLCDSLLLLLLQAARHLRVVLATCKLVRRRRARVRKVARRLVARTALVAGAHGAGFVSALHVRALLAFITCALHHHLLLLLLLQAARHLRVVLAACKLVRRRRARVRKVARRLVARTALVAGAHGAGFVSALHVRALL